MGSFQKSQPHCATQVGNLSAVHSPLSRQTQKKMSPEQKMCLVWDRESCWSDGFSNLRKVPPLRLGTYQSKHVTQTQSRKSLSVARCVNAIVEFQKLQVTWVNSDHDIPTTFMHTLTLGECMVGHPICSPG